MQFNGFSPEAQVFLQSLEQNNNKSWFEQRRTEYEYLLLDPLRKLVMDLSADMLEIDPEIEVRPVINKTISRIYRDTRFSKNKSVFRSNMWISFKRPVREWQALPTYFFEITPTYYTYGMGFYEASPNTMQGFRERIDSNEALFRKVISFYPGDPPFSLEGKKYKRIFDPEKTDDIQTWYQRRNLYLICRREANNELFSVDLVQTLRERFLELADLYRFLMEISQAR